MRRGPVQPASDPGRILGASRRRSSRSDVTTLCSRSSAQTTTLASTTSVVLVFGGSGDSVVLCRFDAPAPLAHLARNCSTPSSFRRNVSLFSERGAELLPPVSPQFSCVGWLSVPTAPSGTPSPASDPLLRPRPAQAGYTIPGHGAAEPDDCLARSHPFSQLSEQF